MTATSTQRNPAQSSYAAASYGAPTYARPAAPPPVPAAAPPAAAPARFAATTALAPAQGRPSTIGLASWTGSAAPATTPAGTVAPAPAPAPADAAAATANAPAPTVPAYAEAFGADTYVKNAQDATLNGLAKAMLAKSPELADSPLARAVAAGQMGAGEVTALQEHLRSKGYAVGETGADGKYGPNTHQGLANFLAGKPADMAPVAPTATGPLGDAQPLENPEDFHISQYPGESNPNEDTASNGNCGPVSTLMALKGLGVVDPSAAQVDGMVEDIRRRGGATMEERVGRGSGTTAGQLAQAARSYGADAQTRTGASVKDIEAALNNNQLVVALVKPGAYSSSRSTGHYVTVTGIKNGNVIVNDPAQQSANRVIDARAFQRAMDSKGGAIVTISA